MHIFADHRARFLAVAASVTLGVLAAAPALAQQPGGIAKSVARFTPDVKVLGQANAQSIIHFQVALSLRDYDGLARSNAAGKTLGYATLEQLHLPTQSDYDAVATWLTRQGFTIEKTHADRLTIEVSGSVGSIARALGVHFSRILSEGQAYDSADSEPVLPAAFTGRVLSVNGLQPHLHAHPAHIVVPLSATAPPLFPAAWISGYSATGLGGGGAGTTTAIVIDTFPKNKDLTKFWSITAVSQSLSNITFIQTVSGTLPGPSGEESLDVETSSSIGPASKVRVYASKTLSFVNLDTAFQAVIRDLQAQVKITQVSISLGACETAVSTGQANTDDGFFATMSSLGASVFVSTGDSGSHECGSGTSRPSFYSTSPNVTAVGGTTLKLKASGVEKSETSWSGSGGGISTKFAVPSYQSGLGFQMRTVPDVASDANPSTGALVILGGSSFQFGGTSLSAPMWAGLMGLVNSDRIAASKPTLGLLNGRIYSLVGTNNFRDITVGNNGGFSALVGYDLVTGIGAPVLSHLLPTLVAQP